LKDNLSKAPILANPDYHKPFILQCDSYGIGAVLAQKNEEGIETPIAYFSKKLNKAQSNYSVTEQECLAVVLSLKKFRPYIEGQDFIILDHFTKFPIIRTIKKFNSSVVIKHLNEEVFPIFGSPQSIISDNGQQFKCRQLNKFLENRRVHHIYTALYSPQANAIERVNRSIITGITMYLKEDHKIWDIHIHDILASIRSSVHQSTKFSP